MNKYLIFRTDRIGDFLLSLILIKSIKRNNINSHITVVASNKNYDYIKSFKIIDEVFLFEEGILNRIKLILLLKKKTFNYVICHDGKKRSKFISFFLNSEFKYFLKKNRYKSFFEEIKIILNNLNFNFDNTDFNTLDNRNLSNVVIDKKNYFLLHFDEKWILNKYISSYIDIEPSLSEFENFISVLFSKTNKNIYISSGIETPSLLDKFFKRNTNTNIVLFNNLNFLQIEKLICDSSLLISCHGAVSHIASAVNVKQIDIIDKSYDYNKWTSHFRNYNCVYRKNFKDLYKEILQII